MEEETQKVNKKEMEKETLEEIVKKVDTALSGTQNSSALGPYSISYRFIKGVKDSILEERVLEVVASNLIKEIIPREW